MAFMSEKVKIFILGTYHFGNSGEHLVDINCKDVITNQNKRKLKK